MLLKNKESWRGKMTVRKRKYDAITQYLVHNGGSQVTLTFTQFDELLFPSKGLPKTARETKDWWVNDYLYPENGAYAWINANYEVIRVDLKKEFVIFRPLVKENLFVNDSFPGKR